MKEYRRTPPRMVISGWGSVVCTVQRMVSEWPRQDTENSCDLQAAGSQCRRRERPPWAAAAEERRRKAL